MTAMDIQFASYGLKIRERQLIGPGGPVELSSRSFDILVALLGRPNEMIGKSDLFDAAWPGIVVEENTLQVHVSSLRKLLGPGFIETVHGRGYKYVGPLPKSVASETTTRAVPATGGNIPDFRPECVARGNELAAISNLLQKHRITSIVGPGGVGKTTLAIESAAMRQSRFSSGVWVVDLAPIGDPVHVASTIVQTLGVQFQKSMPVGDALSAYLRTEELLLVLDNCEHLPEAVAEIVTAILARAPRVRILVTSQIPLNLPDEFVFKLGPFALPEFGEEGANSPSAEFFRHCYESQGEQVSDSEWIAIGRLCRSLDGVALSLKMAAARSTTLGIETVEKQITSKISELASSWPTQLSRHKSLIAALTWSYGLLTPAEQKVFRALSVFNGSFSIDAASAVTLEKESLSELVRKSLVVRDGKYKGRYRLLETSRHFARDQLKLANEEEPVGERHASHLIQLFAGGAHDWERMPDRQWLDIYEPDTGNLRSALEWFKTRGQLGKYAELAANSYRLWLETGLPREGLSHCRHAMQSAGKLLNAGLEADLRLALAELCRAEALDQLSVKTLEPAINFFRNASSKEKFVQANSLRGLVYMNPRQLEQAQAVISEMQELLPGLETSKIKAFALTLIGMNQWLKGEKLPGLARCEAGLAMHRATGNTRSGLKSGLYVAEILYWKGDAERAIAIGMDLLKDLRKAGYKRELGMQLHNLASYHLATGAVDRAREFHLESLEYFSRDDTSWHWSLLQTAAGIEAVAGDPRRAASLLGFVDNCYANSPESIQTTEELERAFILERLVEKLPEDELAVLLNEGKKLSLFEAGFVAGFPAEI
ncbi:MAG: winged helix-turn-helix domain-containing protein [Aestuariivirga sp.]